MTTRTTEPLSVILFYQSGTSQELGPFDAADVQRFVDWFADWNSAFHAADYFAFRHGDGEQTIVVARAIESIHIRPAADE